jgi:hypothetical protein
VDEDIFIFGSFFLTVVILGLGIPLVRAYIRRMDRRSTLPATDLASDARLARIEQAIDAMAVEIERISESQRFVTRVLTERPAERAALPSARLPDHTA